MNKLSNLYCPMCGSKLQDHDRRLAGIGDYAKSLLINFLENNPDLAREADIEEIPGCATERICADGSIMFNRFETSHVIVECWNEVEAALDYWRETNGCDYPVRDVEQLHVFSVTRHAEMVWQEITSGMQGEHLDGETIIEAIDRLKSC